MWYLHSHLVCANEFSLLAIFALPPVFCGLEHPQYTPGKAILYNSLDSTRIAGGFLCNLLRSLRRVTSPHKKKPPEDNRQLFYNALCNVCFKLCHAGRMLHAYNCAFFNLADAFLGKIAHIANFLE